MKATVEVSLYPLTEGYEEVVIDFIESLKDYDGIDLAVNGMSTQVFGSYDQVMRVLNIELKRVFQSGKAIAVTKMAPGELSVENLPESLK